MLRLELSSRTLQEESCLVSRPCVKIVSSEYEKVLHTIRDDIGSHLIWLCIEETTDSCGRYMANVIVGKLSPSEPGKGHLILCRELDVTNHRTIVRTVQAALLSGLLWPTFPDEEVNKVLTLVTDAAPYMIKAGKSLKLLYPKMLHVNFLAHAMHKVAKELREKLSSVNSVISSVKKIFVKAPSRVRAFNTMHPELPLPLEPILTRWGTWILVAFYYAKNHRAIEEVINTFDEADSRYIAKAKATFKMKGLMPSLTFIKAYMSVIPEAILKLESRGMELVEVVTTIQGVVQEADSWPGETGKTVKQKLEFMLAPNPGWSAALDLERMLRGESEPSEDFPNYSAQQAESFKYLPLVSVDVERSFSSLKLLLTDLRKSFKTKNIEKILVVQSNADLLH
ncbi:uncharacterized protein [Anabrus simplex]|uniref:uncharacterized protein n=1 Tax=Anabrus simplex TaxID=316456 RepID=UPI0035A38A85